MEQATVAEVKRSQKGVIKKRRGLLSKRERYGWNGTGGRGKKSDKREICDSDCVVVGKAAG